VLHETRLRVRFGETDLAGHVNNAVYLSYLEEARVDFFRSVFQTERVPLILASAKLDFMRQVFFPDLIRIETGILRLGRTSFDMIHRLFREQTGEMALIGVATLVRFNYSQQSPEPLDDFWRERLNAYLVEPHLSGRDPS